MKYETFFGEILKKHGRIKEYHGKELVFEDVPVQVLQKRKDRDFVILNVTDIHLSDYDIRYFMGISAMNTVRKIVKEVKPDLITVTGDIVCGTASNKSIKRFVELMESFGVPWAPVYGNHDDETNCDLNYLTGEMMKGKHCLMKPGPGGMRVGNYVININDEDGNTVQTLFMTDSNHSQPNEKQTEWFVKKSESINTKQTAIMLHIPLPDYQYAYDAFFDTQSGKWKQGSGGCGENHERICCERDKDKNPVDRGFLEKARFVKTLKNVICGHEHRNDWSVNYNGVRLTYTMKVGKGSGFQIGFNGATVFNVNENGMYRMRHIVRKNGKNRVLEDIKM